MLIFKAWLPVLVYGLVIYLFSALLKPGPLNHPWDWLLHFFEFLPLGFFVSRAILLSGEFSRRLAVIGGALLGLAFGFLDEWHQSFVPGRDATLIDALVDGVAALVGAALYPYLGQVLFKMQKLYKTLPPGCETCPIVK